jgi:hypothetical protein
MKIKNLFNIAIVVIFLLAVLNIASATPQAVPICTKPGNTCASHADCCPLYFTDEGTFYGACLDGYCQKISNITQPEAYTQYQQPLDRDALALCKEIYGEGGNIINYELRGYYVNDYSDLIGWNRGIALAREYRTNVPEYLDKHVCDLIFPEHIVTNHENFDYDKFTYKYDLYGNLISISSDMYYNGLGMVFEQERNYYDMLHPTRPYASYNVDTGLTRFYYGGLGNIIKITDSRGNQIIKEYDDYHRVKRIYSLQDPNINVIYHYGNDEDLVCINDGFPITNAANKVCKINDTSGSTYYLYLDDRGRLTHEFKYIKTEESGMGEFFSKEYNYNYDDSLKQIKIGGDSIYYDYNELGQLINIKYPIVGDVFANYAEYEYNPTGTVAEKTSPTTSSDLFTSYSYDVRDRLTSIYISPQDPYGFPILFERTYEWDDAGNLEHIYYEVDRDVPGTPGIDPAESFAYDTLDRLKDVDYDLAQFPGAPSAISYEYDMVGNRLIMNKGGDTKDYDYIYNKLVKIT